MHLTPSPTDPSSGAGPAVLPARCESRRCVALAAMQMDLTHGVAGSHSLSSACQGTLGFAPAAAEPAAEHLGCPGWEQVAEQGHWVVVAAVPWQRSGTGAH